MYILSLIWAFFLLPVSFAESDFGPLVNDPAPKKITRGIHYHVSNENKPYLFKSKIQDLFGRVYFP